MKDLILEIQSSAREVFLTFQPILYTLHFSFLKKQGKFLMHTAVVSDI